MPDREQLLRELGFAFRRADRSLRRLRGRETHLLADELGHARLELLGELWERGPLPAGELAAAADLSAATVSQMLDRLEEAGHVQRERREGDRRVVVVKLTPRGRRKVERRKAMWRARWEEALRDVDEDELRAGAAVLDRIAGVFEEPRD